MNFKFKKNDQVIIGYPVDDNIGMWAKSLGMDETIGKIGIVMDNHESLYRGESYIKVMITMDNKRNVSNKLWHSRGERRLYDTTRHHRPGC